jgi:oligoendopeptidase F
MLQPTLVRYRERRFLPADFRVVDWDGLEPFYRELMERRILCLEDLEAWLRDRSELEAITMEDARWRFIQTTRDTASADHAEDFRRFAAEIKPELVRREQALDRKFLDSPYTELLPKQRFFPYLRKLKRRLELFREENVALQAEHQILQKEYDRISGALSVELDGQEYTMQQASLALTDPDRSRRQAIY